MTIRALLVDDDPDTRAILALALDLHPRFVATAVSRSEAAALLRRGTERFDAILLDMKISDMSAAALIATLRQWSKAAVPVVLLSARAGEADRRTYRVSGAHGVIAKPYDPVALPDRIAAMLAVASIARERVAGAR